MTEKIKTLKIIHLAICGAIILFYIVISLALPVRLQPREYVSEDMIYMVIPILAFLLSNFFYRSQLKNMASKVSPEEKLSVYQMASITRWAVLEASALFMLFLKPDMLLLGIVIILYLISIRPTTEGINRKLEKS